MAPKLEFVLKVLSMSRGRLAAQLGVDKSAVGRWVTGTTVPSNHNLAQLTALVSARVEGFTSLDWDKDLDGLAEALGVARRPARAPDTGDGLPAALVEQSLLTTRLRGSAYAGIFRSTRPYAQHPGLFVHDAVMIRPTDGGHLEYQMSAAGVVVSGRVMLLQNQLFCFGGELTSGSFAFAILNGVSTVQAGALDGLLLYCALDPGRTPTATPAIYERVCDLTGDRAADDARFEALSGEPSVAPEGVVPKAIRDHLVRDIGPGHLAAGGDWLLQAPLLRSLARGLGPPPPDAG
ncbi:MAG: helix-turn-helix transcriptional regulator [Caulobacteraceae bacterium]